MIKGVKFHHNKKLLLFVIILLIILVILIICLMKIQKKENNQENNTGLANPASIYCVEHNGTLEIRTDANGSQYGVCVFDDNSECEEWEYYYGECRKNTMPQKPLTDTASIIGKVISIYDEKSEIEILNVTSYNADPRNQSIKLEEGTNQDFVFQWGISKTTVDMPPIGPSESDINLEGIKIGDIIQAEISFDYEKWRVYKYEVTN